MSRTQASRSSGKFVFRKSFNIGAADAVEDAHFLAESFIDTGDLDVLKNTTRPESIVLGRTGSGKTAILRQLSVDEERVISLIPDNLALSYLGNNGVLQFFTAAGVNMDLFYRLLWRHIFAVEITREVDQVVDEASQKGFLRKLSNLLGINRAKEEALQYLTEWGKSFWKETEYRVQEVTSKFEEDLSRSAKLALKASLPEAADGSIELNAALVKRLSEEQRAEVQYYGQEVVNRVQMTKLSRIIDLLNDDILVDRQKRFYITIDRLDESWAPDSLRYDLIKALLETSRDFNNRIENVKVIVALRLDLIDRVFRYTRDSGYQEEKYDSLKLFLRWNHRQLEDLLDRRVNQLIREQYTNQSVTMRKLLPDSVLKNDTVEYMVQRTMYRPRDMIAFFNECMSAALDRPRITQNVLLRAEGVYSQKRLRALADEWSADYPNLFDFCICLKGLPSHFRRIAIEDELIERLVTAAAKLEKSPTKKGRLYEGLSSAIGWADRESILMSFFKTMYQVGVLGVKPEPYLNVHWSYREDKALHFEEHAVFHIHPAFYRVLGISP